VTTDTDFIHTQLRTQNLLEIKLAIVSTIAKPVTLASMHSTPEKSDLLTLLMTTPPAFSSNEAETLAENYFGIKACATSLVSERDQNFLLTMENGERYVLKITNQAEPAEVIDFQTCALHHIGVTDPSIPVPCVIPTLDGDLHCRVDMHGQSHTVRVLSWVDGIVLGHSKTDPGIITKLGEMLARLGLALDGFEHPGSDPPLLWDMKKADGLRDLLVHVTDRGQRQLIEGSLDQFETNMKPILSDLRSQVIHNDFNPGNVLLDKNRSGSITGIIDFGDMVKSPLIIDLAVASSYQLSRGSETLAGALPMIAGYHDVRPLQEVEMSLLTGLIRVRLVTSLLINRWRTKLFPENRDYLMGDYRSTEQFLLGLQNLSADAALGRITSVCSQ
jgi:Ser/Thr protein kinase RdoA (MazF antagonist)